MLLTLPRDVFTDISTIGEVSIDGVKECQTLELPNKDGKPGSCIPQGLYPVIPMPSPKFMGSQDPWVKQFASQMPHIMEIPGRSLIMFHWGNFPNETDGCVLVGQTRLPDAIGGSRFAFEHLFAKIEEAMRHRDCFVQVIGGARVDVPNNHDEVQDVAAGG